MRAFAVASAAFAVALACGACGACAPGGKSDAARAIEVLVKNDAETLDPRYATDAVAMRVTRLVHAGLVRLDPTTLEPRPYLASSWRWTSPTTLHVDLREDVRFHSGAPFGARDVVATLAAFASPEVGSRHARVVDAIADAREDGPHAVVIRLSRAHATLLTDLELPILRADQAASAPDPSGELDGLGPFTVARFERGTISLSPAEHAALPTPAHAVAVRTVHDENARALRLYAGRADVALNELSPTLLPAMDGKEGLAIVSRPGANVTYIVVREEHGPLANVDVRRAIAQSIDRDLLARTLLGGRAQSAAGLIAPTHWAYAAPRAALAYDPAAARAHLAGAGIPTTPHLALSMLTSTDRLRLSIARTIAQELAEVGIELEVIPLELGTLLARLNAGDFELAMLQLPELGEPHVLRHFLHSAFVPPAGANRGRVRDDVLDALLDEGGRTSGIDARRPIYAAVEERLRETLHVIPLWHEDQVAVTSQRARAFMPSAEGRWLSLAALP